MVLSLRELHEGFRPQGGGQLWIVLFFIQGRPDCILGAALPGGAGELPRPSRYETSRQAMVGEGDIDAAALGREATADGRALCQTRAEGTSGRRPKAAERAGGAETARPGRLRVAQARKPGRAEAHGGFAAEGRSGRRGRGPRAPRGKAAVGRPRRTGRRGITQAQGQRGEAAAPPPRGTRCPRAAAPPPRGTSRGRRLRPVFAWLDVAKLRRLGGGAPLGRSLSLPWGGDHR